ncbi:Aldedh-domain-containing protein [Viridothelium virens]|uniref:aldehyde dehydrogenase (NAD(+)) n=1 Tax=Viridothelium virens TaxID=1048519 RepID=A0A6A6HIV4_VIRVR|nr:Aldedh-domain-containing protein [Viridothelium virens]
MELQELTDLIPSEAAVLSAIFLILFVPILYIILSGPSFEEPVEYDVPVPEQCRQGWDGKILDEPSIKASGSTAIQCYCPTNGKFLGLVNPTTPDGIDRAITKAHEAQIEWAKTSFDRRRKVLRTLLKHILDNQDVIARAACLDSGKTMVDASFGEILVTAEKLKWTIDHGEKALRPSKRPTNLLMMYKKNEVRYEPLGVVAACVSWNYPFHNLLGPIISSLFTGNAIVLKPSERTAWSSNYFISVVKSALEACGHSPHLVQSVTCWPQAASHLTSHPVLSHITFIGSRPVAHSVASSAAKALTPLTLELGGKDPAIILDDARNLPAIASILMRGVFQSSGQNCIGIERIVATPKVYPQLLALLEPRIRALRLGSALDDTGADADEIDMGACISDDGFSRLESLIAAAVKDGARLLCGGRRCVHPRHPAGHYFAPTLLVDVTPEMDIAQQELFAPVAVLMRAADVRDAIRIANATPYALGASVFGSEPYYVNQVVAGLEAGMVSVNDFAAYYAVQLPFGGVKGSGYGRFAGEEGLRSLCNAKSVCEDRTALVGTKIPRRLDYPISGGSKPWEMCKGIVELGYRDGWRAKVDALRRLLRNS